MKTCQKWKSGNFQKVLKSSIRLQITCWTAEKIDIECLIQRLKKIHSANAWEDEFFVSWLCFLIFLKMCKKHDPKFALITDCLKMWQAPKWMQNRSRRPPKTYAKTKVFHRSVTLFDSSHTIDTQKNTSSRIQVCP